MTSSIPLMLNTDVNQRFQRQCLTSEADYTPGFSGGRVAHDGLLGRERYRLGQMWDDWTFTEQKQCKGCIQANTRQVKTNVI